MPALLRNWRMTDGEHPTVAGMVMFGRKPHEHLPNMHISAAHFPGTDIGDDLLDQKDLTGRLLDVIDEAERFLNLNLRTPHRIRGFEREDHPELPTPALREAVVNAVAHRDYTCRDRYGCSCSPTASRSTPPGRPRTPSPSRQCAPARTSCATRRSTPSGGHWAGDPRRQRRTADESAGARGHRPGHRNRPT
jgi:hypothetical protein